MLLKRLQLANVFWLFILLYFITFTLLLFFIQTGWFITGMLIGGIYFFIAAYYFYENFILQHRAINRNPYALIAEWLIPAIIVQLFVILGFMITLTGDNLKGSIYTNPYHYGQIYKQLNEFQQFQNEWTMSVIKTEDDAIVMVDKIQQKQDLQTETLSKVLKDYFPSEKCSVEMIHDNPDCNEKELSVAEIKLSIYQIPFLIALTFGFLGTLIYTLQDTAFRLYTNDLYPQTFMSCVARFIFAPSLSMIVAYAMMHDWMVGTAPLLFFFIGYFPQRALQYIKERAMSILGLKLEEMKYALPLNRLQGMTDYLIYRFMEIGISDVQNLAYADLHYLDENIGYNNRLLGDFVAQSLLLVHVKEQDFIRLQDLSIRNIIAFKDIVTLDNYQDIAQKANIESEKLHHVLILLGSDLLRKRVNMLENFIGSQHLLVEMEANTMKS